MSIKKSQGAIGAAILLKVMSGDRIHTKIDYYYTTANTNNSGANELNSLLANLATALSGSAQAGQLIKEASGTLSGALAANAGLAAFLDEPNNSSGSNQAPKAYLNVLFFDEQFKFDEASSGIFPVAYSPNSKQSISRLASDALEAGKNGYVYVYFSNESETMLYFDNFLLTHEKGRILEETHYYPFGLVMSGISSKALNGAPENKRKWNKGSELESKEFSDGSGLELYSTFYRSLDPQLGRFWQIDPKPDYSQSLYTSMNNNPNKFNDPLGDTARIQFRTGFLGLGGKKQVDYNNGKLTNKDGSAYTGKVKGFLKRVVGGLDKLSAGGATGKGLVNDIVNSTQTVNIIRGDNSFNANDKATGMTNVVRWDPSNTSGGPDAALNQSRPGFIGLGHELAHAQDQIFDEKIDYGKWYLPTGESDPNKFVRNAEFYSTHIENLLRAENHLNLRAFYSLYTDPSGVIKGEGQILIPGTRQNTNTITANGLNLVNPIY